MITLLTGENSFEIQRELDKIAADFDGEAERIDGGILQLNQLPDVLMGASLFVSSRLVIIRGLSENKAIWPVFGDWLSRVSDDIHLVLVEPKLDKRTSTYKALVEKADVKEYLPWSERDYIKAEKWLQTEAKKLQIEMDTKCVQFLVQRVGVDQWQLSQSLNKLSLIDQISIESICDTTEPNPIENVFDLFEAAVNCDTDKLKLKLAIIEQTEDAHRLLALMSSQVFQLLAVAFAGPDDNPAKDLGIHPFVVSKMTPLAKRLGKQKVAQIVNIFAECDDDMKISRAEPWLLLERALFKVSNSC